MSTQTQISSTEVIRREVSCNRVHLGSICATEQAAIEYFRDSEEGSDYFYALDLDTPHHWVASPVVM